MKVEINAVVTRGYNAATYAIPRQAPHLLPFFPQIEMCRHSTINLRLSAPLHVRLPDIVTPPIDWEPPEPNERFGFTRIGLALADDPIREAWIYTAEKSSHRFNALMIEVLAEPLNGIAPGVRCKVHIDRCIGSIII